MRGLYAKYQRSFNKVIRQLNKDIAEDDLWRGRFEFRQKCAVLEKFTDGSGGILHLVIRGYDKKTGYYKDFRLEYAPWLQLSPSHLYLEVNNFIARDSGVWKEDPRPDSNNAKDYTNQGVPDSVMKKPWNFYSSFDF